MKARSLQIDVKGPSEDNPSFIEFNLIVDGRTCRFFMHRANYEALMFDKVFIRDGKEKDSAGILNTTNVFIEKHI